MDCFQILDGLQLLAVDDDTDTLGLITVIFEVYKVKVMTARLSDKAFQLITQFKPDILISDIVMPEEDGYSLIRKIRTHKDEQVRQIPALALTGLAYQESFTLARDAGFNAYLIKPFDLDGLITTVSNLANLQFQLIG